MLESDRIRLGLCGTVPSNERIGGKIDHMTLVQPFMLFMVVNRTFGPNSIFFPL